MAVVNAAAVAAALAQLLGEKIHNQINRAVVMLKLLPHATEEGKNLAWDARFSAAGAASDSSIADGADVSVFEDDDRVPATLNWGIYSQAFGVTGFARAVSRQPGGPSQLEDLFGDVMLGTSQRLALNIARDVWTGPGGGTRILGLFGGATLTSGAPLSAAGTYATIDRAVRTQWQGNVLANGGTPRALSFQLMRDMRREIYEACGMMPDLIVCDPFQHEQYGMLFGSERRYVQDITLRGQKFTLDGGYKALEFDGIPIIADVNAPAGQLTWLNTSYVKLAQMPDGVDDVNQSKQMVTLAGTAEEQLGEGRTNLFARINPLARTGDAYKFQFILYPQMKVERCNAHGVLADLITA